MTQLSQEEFNGYMDEFIERILGQSKPVAHEYGYTIEPHGDAYALYFGRGPNAHGFNLCRIDDMAHNCDLKEIERLLNAGLDAGRK